MTTFYLIHGSYGNPNENWFPWLKEELEKDGHEVVAPTFPTPENQSLDSWKEILSELPEDCVVIGHSLGVPFLLTLLETQKAKAAFFVAGFASLLGNEFDEVNKTFVVLLVQT